MKKIILATAIASLVACGGGSGGSSGNEQPTPTPTPTNTAPTVSNVSILYGEDKTIFSDVVTATWAGAVLTGSYTYNDAEGDEQDSSQTGYRWLVDGAEVSTALAYQSKRSDTGKEITFEVTPVAKTGVTTGQLKSSAAAKLTSREQVFFSAEGPLFVGGPDGISVIKNQLYITDGTDSGTVSLTEGSGDPSTPVAVPTAQAGYAIEKWVFTQDRKLWVTDGSSEGTHAIQIDDNGTSVGIVETADYLTAFNGYVYFQGDEYNAGGNIQNREIWRTDGTAAGTQLVVDLHPQGNSNAAQFTVMADSLYFVADFKFNGINYGKEIYRLEKDNSYDLVKDIKPGSSHSNPSELTVLNDKLYFVAEPTTGAFAAYATDGTEAGTIELKRHPSQKAYNFTAVNDAVYFTLGSWGTLYRTQGTLASTKVEGINSDDFNHAVNIVPSFNDLLIFRATKQGSAYAGLIGFEHQSNRLNTSYLLDAVQTPAVPVVLNDRIAFVAANASSFASRLYFTSRGDFNNKLATKININPNGNPNLQNLTELNDQLLFVATTDDYGQELWISDGTEEGTKLFKDVRSGTNGSSPVILSGAENDL